MHNRGSRGLNSERRSSSRGSNTASQRWCGSAVYTVQRRTLPRSFRAPVAREIGLWTPKAPCTPRSRNIDAPEDIDARPDIGCYISGLYLEGAVWDEREGALANPPVGR